MRKNEIVIHQGDPGGDRLGQDLGRGGDNGFYVLISCAASLVVAIFAAAVASRILMGETAAGTYLVTTANVIMTLVAVILWSTSFVGMTRHLKSHYGNKHAGFYLLISCAASLAVAIIAAAVAGRILMGETAAGTYWVITANVITALVVVILWSISFVGMFRYLKSYYENKQGGHSVSL